MTAQEISVSTLVLTNMLILISAVFSYIAFARVRWDLVGKILVVGFGILALSSGLGIINNLGPMLTGEQRAFWLILASITRVTGWLLVAVAFGLLSHEVTRFMNGRR